MNTMNEEQRLETMMMLRETEWTHAISFDARDPTLGGLWLSITEGMERLKKKEPELCYWLAASIGDRTEKPHYHGVMRTALSQNVIVKAFKECNEPTIKTLYNRERWYDYVVKQSLTETTITNIQENELCEESIHH
jgi:hypothetical protein